MKDNRLGYHDIPYGIASASITSTGLVAVATTGGDYHGIRCIAGTTSITIIVFDGASTTAGNILDVVKVSPGGQHYNDNFNPVVARKGITLGIVGTGGTGVVFFNPKG